MYERKIIPHEEFGKIELKDVCRYVLVNKFTEDSFKQFVENCSKILNLGQDFHPIVIDSFGGIGYSLFSMIDFLESLDVQIITICEGKAMSCGSLLLSCGEQRYVGPNAITMVHDVSGFNWGKNIELQNSAKEINRLNRLAYSILDKNTNQKSGYWKSLVKENKYADLYLTPQKALKHNLATQMGVPYIKTTVTVDCELVT